MQASETQWVVLTGATGGIGECLTRLLRANGLGVIAIGRDRSKLATLAGPDTMIETCTVDLADPPATEALAKTLADTRSIIGLINNAAVQNATLLWKQSAEQIDEEIRINLTAPSILVSRLMQVLPTGTGYIVNVTSGLAVAPKSNAAVYCATKAGLRNLTAAIANQVEPRDRIAVIDVVLPLVDTGMTRGRGTGKMPAEAAAEAIMGAIRRRRTVAWVGKAKLLASIHRIAPSIAARIMRRS